MSRNRAARLQHHALQSLLAVRPLERLYAGQSRRDGGAAVLVRQVLPGLPESEHAETARLFEEHFSRLQTLTLPGCLPLRERHDAGGGAFYLVQDAPIGVTLGDLMRAAGPLPVGTAARLAVDVIDLLIHARAAGVHHFGLNRGSVLLDARGAVTLLDLGIAPFILERLAGRLQRVHPAWDSLFPDPTALSPELIASETLSEATDVYGVGALLFLMLTARMPYGGSAMLAYNAILAGRTPLSPRTIASDLPEDISALVESCLQRRPEDRPASLEALRAPLAAVAVRVEDAAAAVRGFVTDQPWTDRFRPLLRVVENDDPEPPTEDNVVVPHIQAAGRPMSDIELLARMSQEQRRIYLAGGGAPGVHTRAAETRRGMLLGVALALIALLFFAPKILGDFGLLDDEPETINLPVLPPVEPATRRASENFDTARERRGAVLYLDN